jgi:hypothetical protein
MSPGWLLDWVAVTAAPPAAAGEHKHQAQQQQGRARPPAGRTWWFAARRWLDAARGLEVELPAADALPPEEGALYTVKVHTSDVRWGRAGCLWRALCLLLSSYRMPT